MVQSFTDQSHLITSVDKFVKDVLSHRIHFEDIKSFLNRWYNPFMFSLDLDLSYAQSINAFVGSTQQVVGDQYPCEVIWNYENTLHFQNFLLSYENIISLEKILRHNQEVKNRYSLDGYIREVANTFFKSLFVRVDLGYLSESKYLVSIEDFYEHIKKLRHLISNKDSCFKSVHGYAWALEQGYDRGYHCHLLLIYNGSERQKDGYIGRTVGEKWQEITGGLGSYFNVNNPEYKNRFKHNQKLGVGMIPRNNPEQVENAVNAALYLTKPDKHDQHLKVMLKNMVTFGRGEIKPPKQ